METGNINDFRHLLGDTINFKKLSVDVGIYELRKKRHELRAKKPSFPQKKGKGDVADEVEMIGQTYEKIYESMLLLLNNTIDFLENAKGSLISTDEAIANSFLK